MRQWHFSHSEFLFSNSAEDTQFGARFRSQVSLPQLECMQSVVYVMALKSAVSGDLHWQEGGGLRFLSRLWG